MNNDRMKTWRFEVTLKVADSWIADGFDCSERIEQIEEAIAALLPYAYESEVSVKIRMTKSPDNSVLESLRSGQ